MVRINKIFTRTGDSGQTSLAQGQQVSKTSERIRLLGALDELNSFLGSARTAAVNSGSGISDKLASLQNIIFDIGAEIACITPPAPAIVSADLDLIEKEITSLSENQSELKSFILPGGNQLNSTLHICRSVCRRCEISAWQLNEKEVLDNNLLIYLNRLSDYFFALAREASALNQSAEYLWIPRGKNPGTMTKN